MINRWYRVDPFTEPVRRPSTITWPIYKCVDLFTTRLIHSIKLMSNHAGVKGCNLIRFGLVV